MEKGWIGFCQAAAPHSRTSQYAQRPCFKMVDNTSMRQFIEEQYNKIVDGSFAQEWEEVKADDMKKFDELRAETESCPSLWSRQRSARTSPAARPTVTPSSFFSTKRSLRPAGKL